MAMPVDRADSARFDLHRINKIAELQTMRDLNMMNDVGPDMPCCRIQFLPFAMNRIHDILSHPTKCVICSQDCGPTDREVIGHMLFHHDMQNDSCCLVNHTIWHDDVNEAARWETYLRDIRACAVQFSSHFDVSPHERALREERLNDTIARNLENRRNMNANDEIPQCCQTTFKLYALESIHSILRHPELCHFCNFRGGTDSDVAAHIERSHPTDDPSICPIVEHRVSHQDRSDTYDKWLQYIEHTQNCASTHSFLFDW